MPENSKSAEDARKSRSNSRSERLQEGQTPSDSSAGYRDRPSEDGKHGDAGAEQAENLSNSNSRPDTREVTRGS
jgi:hypothetical protein